MLKHNKVDYLSTLFKDLWQNNKELSLKLILIGYANKVHYFAAGNFSMFTTFRIFSWFTI